VAFDALLETYGPAELIGLQYHLHIPGPDPLTNPATVERARYYGANSTPSTFLNGESAARGGGTMAMAEAKYGQYRELIEERLAGRRRAAIDLGARRDGDTIAITVRASVDAPTADDADADAGAEDAPEPRLRLALVEESIRFVGGNKLRFHHHVVRAMPGGPEGFAFADGSCAQELTLPLDDVRGEIEAYLSDSARTHRYPQPPPPVELKGLSVVAFVQDDADRSVWHAVQVRLDDTAAPRP